MTTSVAPSIAHKKPQVFQTWESLKRSNTIFARNNEMAEQRTSLREGQMPSCIVLSCSDSRVSPEIIFNANLGELFVVRVAGEVVDTTVLHSIEYAVGMFHPSTIVVLGHAQCGAVIAALQRLQEPCHIYGPEDRYLHGILNPIEQAILAARIDIHAPEALEAAIQANVRHAAYGLAGKSTCIADALAAKKLIIVGAEYCLGSGIVEELFIIE